MLELLIASYDTWKTRKYTILTSTTYSSQIESINFNSF